MDAILRKKFLNVIREKIITEKNGYIFLNTIPKAIETQLNINYQDHTEGRQLKHWFASTFPEFQIFDSNGKEKVCASYLEMRRILAENIERFGKISLPQVPELLSTELGVEYMVLSKGAKLKVWLKESFPSIKFSEDDRYIEAISYKSAKKTVDSSVQSEIDFMHNFAFMGWWNVNYKNLKAFANLESIVNERQLSEVIAHNMLKALYGEEIVLLDASEDENPRIVFDTGIRSKDMNNIYCILGENEKYSEHISQPWKLLGFVCFGDNDINGYGKWLEIRFPHINAKNSKFNINDLKEKIKDLNFLRTNILNEIEECRSLILKGEQAKESTVDWINKYKTEWEKLMGMCKSFPTLKDNNYMSFDEIENNFKENTILVANIARAVELFDGLIDAVSGLYDFLRLENNEHSICNQDKKEIYRLYGESSVITDFGEFRKILTYYKHLHAILLAKNSSTVVAEIESVGAHFTDIHPVFISHLASYDKVNEDDCKKFSVIDEISDIIENCENLRNNNTLNDSVQQIDIDCHKFLIEEIENKKEWKLTKSKIFRNLLLDDEYFRAIAFGDFDRAVTLKPEIAGCSMDNMPKGLSPYNMAARVLLFFKNKGQIAESLFILGLQVETKECAKSLMRIYREEHRINEFSLIWDNYNHLLELDKEDILFWFEDLCKHDVQEAFDYTKTNVYLRYDIKFLELLINGAKNNGNDTILNILSVYKEKIQSEVEPNVFEEAVINNNIDKINKIGLEHNVLKDLGYDELQIDNITKIIGLGDFSRGVSNYEIGSRLYRFQKNYNGLAERFFWNGLSDGWNDNCGELLRLLMSESRWNEAIALYECYVSNMSKNIKDRELYLIALMNVGYSDLKYYINDNFTDYLSLIIDVPNVIEFIKDKIQSADCIYSDDYFDSLLRVSSYINDSFLRSLLLMDSTLREAVNDFEFLKKNNLSAETIKNIAIIYNTNKYNHGVDVISVAERIFSFIGAKDGIAEDIVMLSGDNKLKNNLLWEIYQENNDQDKQYDLLREDEELRIENISEYLKLLYAHKEYEEFLNNINVYQLERIDLIFMGMVAQMKYNKQVEFEMPLVMDKVEYAILIDFIVCLNSLQKTDFIASFVVSNFDYWTSQYHQSELTNIISAGRTLSNELMERIQMLALENNNFLLAIYYYKYLGVGDLSNKLEEYYLEAVNELSSLNKKDQLSFAQKIKLIFGDKAANIDSQIAATMIQDILDSAGDEKNIASRINEILKTNNICSDDLIKIYDAIKDNDICFKYLIYTELTECSRKVSLEKYNLEFFHSIRLKEGAAEKTFFQDYLAKLYYDALKSGYIPENIIEEAKVFCQNLAFKNKSIFGFLSLYYFYYRDDKIHYANAILFYLIQRINDISNDRNSLESNEIINLANKKWSGCEIGFTEVFKAMLIDYDIAEIKEYIDFTSNFFEFDIGESLVLKNNHASGELMSDEESNKALYFLCADPYNNTYWDICKNIKTITEPIAYAKFLYLLAEKYPILWKECIKKCDENYLDSIALKAYINWANGSSSYSVDARKHLEVEINKNENYLVRWSSFEDSSKLIEVFANYLKDANELHSGLATTVAIAVKLKNKKCIHILKNMLGKFLFASYADLGVVVLCMLLLDKRIDEAYQWLQSLRHVIYEMKYKELVITLSELDIEELEEWANSEEHSLFIKLILPYGNSPNVEQINLITYNGVINNKALLTVNVLLQLLDIFPDDRAIYSSLFVLCTTQFDGYTSILHRALRGLVRIESPGSSYERYKLLDYAVMLSTLDAVLVATGQTALISSQEYDFNIKAGDYYKKYCPVGVSDNDVNYVNSYYDKVVRELTNRTNEELERYSEAYLACITSNWTKILSCLWAERKADKELEVFLFSGATEVGFAKSLLKVILRLEVNEQNIFVEWIKSKLEGNKDLKYRLMHVCLVSDFINTNSFRRLLVNDKYNLNNLLDIPAEAYQLYGEFKRDVILKAIKSNFELLKELVWLYAVFSSYDYVMSEYLKIADDNFDAGKDDIAYCFYDAIDYMAKNFSVLPKSKKGFNAKFTPQIYNSMTREQVEVKKRLTGLFVGNADITSYVGGPDFHVWSTINMGLVLMSTKRANEIHKLKRYLDQKQIYVIDFLLTIFDNNKTDREKLEYLNQFPEKSVHRVYFEFVLGQYSRSVFSDYENEKKYREKASNVISWVDKEFLLNGKRLHFILKNLTIESYIFNSAEKTNWLNEVDYLSFEDQKVLVLPEYACNIEPSYDGDETILYDLQEKHDILASKVINEEIINEIVVLSRRILSLKLGMTDNIEKQYTALVQYSVDLYHQLCISHNARERYQAHQIIKELLNLPYVNISFNSENKKLIDLVRSLAIQKLLKSYTKLKVLVDDFNMYKVAFLRMKDVIIDVKVYKLLMCVYEILDGLSHSYSMYSLSNSEGVYEKLENAANKLRSSEYSAWPDVKNHIRLLINNEINQIRQKPNLETTIYNKGMQSNVGYFSGRIKNVGSKPATDVTVQVTYCGNKYTSQYTHKCIDAGQCAYFEIPYSVDTLCDSLEFHLDVVCRYQNSIMSFEPYRGRLSIGNIDEIDVTTKAKPKYNTQGPVKVLLDENLEIKKECKFFGRKTETAKLRSLLEDVDNIYKTDEEKFVGYRTAIIHGERRTGKTSLLNYFEQYVNAKLKDVICLNISVHSSDYTIQSVFITPVISGYKNIVTDKILWDSFVSRWSTLPEGAYDRDPRELKDFFVELKRISGYRLIFLIDEFDRLLTNIMNTQSKEGTMTLDNGLFDVLTVMIDDSKCVDSVHFVFSGSNALLRFAKTGDKLQQFFTKVGEDSIIEVGRLPKSDLKDLLESCAEVKYEEDSIELIFDYTEGAVWFTKILGNRAIEYALEANRRNIYPYDVVTTFTEVLNDQNCKQFMESCPWGSPENMVVDAMQCLANARNKYVSINEICELLKWNPEDVQQCLDMLMLFKIIERHPINIVLYRFSLEIYRRYFRSINFSFNRKPENDPWFLNKELIDEASQKKIENEYNEEQSNDDENVLKNRTPRTI